MSCTRSLAEKRISRLDKQKNVTSIQFSVGLIQNFRSAVENWDKIDDRTCKIVSISFMHAGIKCTYAVNKFKNAYSEHVILFQYLF